VSRSEAIFLVQAFGLHRRSAADGTAWAARLRCVCDADVDICRTDAETVGTLFCPVAVL
jgi:hypothetical protein